MQTVFGPYHGALGNPFLRQVEDHARVAEEGVPTNDKQGEAIGPKGHVIWTDKKEPHDEI
jgi:hypothetical protein